MYTVFCCVVNLSDENYSRFGKIHFGNGIVYFRCTYSKYHNYDKFHSKNKFKFIDGMCVVHISKRTKSVDC